MGGSFVTYTDKVLTCSDCGIVFVFCASVQSFLAEKGFASAPKRCASCRAQRRASGGGGSSYGNGGGGGYSSGGGYGAGGGGYSRGPREMFDATCARCGNETQVPFRPTGARPVYCSDCFRLVRG
jgi:CxxC-x17-CxxC domain-containing protein